MKLKKDATATPVIPANTEALDQLNGDLAPTEPQENLEAGQTPVPTEEPILNFPLTWFRGGVTPTKTQVAKGTKTEIQSWFNARYRDRDNKGWIYPIPRDKANKELFENDPNFERVNRNPERTTVHMRIKGTNMKAWYPIRVLPNTKLVAGCFNIYVQDPAPVVDALDPMNLPDTVVETLDTVEEFTA